MAGDFCPPVKFSETRCGCRGIRGAKAPYFCAHEPDSGKGFEPASSQLSADEALALDYVLGILVEPDLGRALTRIKQDMDFGHLYHDMWVNFLPVSPTSVQLKIP